MFRSIPSLRIRGTKAEHFADEVMVEIPLKISVNGTIITTAMTSPVDLTEFVTGFLFTSGVIGSISDINSLKIEDHEAIIIVDHTGGSPFPGRKLPDDSFRISPDQITDGLFEVLESDLHTRTGGAQTVGLIIPPVTVVYRAEDIGRHNALDRVIGYGLLNDIDLRRSFVVCSGRISATMARKCVLAGIPLAATRGATTTEAIRVATEGALTIVGFVRRESMNVYSEINRIKLVQ
jgi:FdhD protein